MKKFKEEKAITLVALIITIIVLLILAVVTISAVNEGSLFAHANNAATGYSKAQEKENLIITNYTAKMKEYEKNIEQLEGDISQVPQTPQPVDPSDLIGTYYCANGDTDFTVIVGETTVSFCEDTETYVLSDNIISANLVGIPVTWTYNELPNGTKTLYSTTGYGVPMLFTTNISGLNTGTLTGKYIKTDRSIEFFSDNTLTWIWQGDSDSGSTKEYTYFTDVNVIFINNEDWLKLDGDILYELSERGLTTQFTKQTQ